MLSRNKGFTLIELLVVIAIIGILSSVVLASLTTARSKGQAAAVQNQLSNTRAQMELYYSSNGNSYSSTGATDAVCTAGAETGPYASGATNGSYNLIVGARSSGGTVTCHATTTAWAISATLPGSGGNWCVDSQGNSTSSAAISATDFNCL